MPNLVYVSREKSKTYPHHFKAGALNTLVSKSVLQSFWTKDLVDFSLTFLVFVQLRVSATMTNAPIVLTLDCDMFSNDPLTPHRVLCFLVEDSAQPTLAYVQFPQRFHGLNKTDIYGCEIKRLFTVNPMGMDGLQGPNYVGSGCFFRRRAFFGSPSSPLQPQIPELKPDHVVNKPITSEEILHLAYHVSSSNYEDLTDWGSKVHT